MTAIARANNICMLTPVGNWEMRESFKTNRNSNAEMLTVAQKSKINFFLEAFEKLIVRQKMEELVNIAPKIIAEFKKYCSADPPSKTNLASPVMAPALRNT